MTWTIWLQFAGVCMLGAMSPGPSLAMVLQQTAAPTSAWRAARTGLAVSLSNPHLAVMFVALLSQFVTADMPASGQALLIATAMGLDFGWYALLTLLISHPSILSGLHRKSRWIDGCGGALMLLLGLRILVV